MKQTIYTAQLSIHQSIDQSINLSIHRNEWQEWKVEGFVQCIGMARAYILRFKVILMSIVSRHPEHMDQQQAHASRSPGLTRTRWTWQSRGKLYKSKGSLNRPQDAARVCNSSNLRHRVQNGSEYLGIWKQQIFPKSSIPALSLLGLLKVTPLATATSPFLSCRHFPQHFLRWKCHRDDWTWTGRKWFRNSKQPGLLI